jgi:hypothetical protein
MQGNSYQDYFKSIHGQNNNDSPAEPHYDPSIPEPVNNPYNSLLNHHVFGAASEDSLAGREEQRNSPNDISNSFKYKLMNNLFSDDSPMWKMLLGISSNKYVKSAQPMANIISELSGKVSSSLDLDKVKSALMDTHSAEAGDFKDILSKLFAK